MKHGQCPSRAFTLIELLVVIAILVLLMTMLLPSLSKARELARMTVCLTQHRAMARAALMYENKYNVLSPMGYRPPGQGNPTVVWYQKRFLGQFFAEDIPRYPSCDGVSGAPPRKSVLRCPSPSVWLGNDPLKSWVAYNSHMSYEYQPPGTDYRCYWRGPKIAEIRNPPDRFLLFGDGRGSGIYYVGDFAYNSFDVTIADTSQSSSRMDERHLGGVNVAFLDGHAKHMGEPTQAHFARLIYLSPTSRHK